MTDSGAHAAGVERGWDAANYAEGYGFDLAETDLAEAYSRGGEPGFADGYAEGIERFRNSEWHDGSPRDDSESE